jgi:hypothetical protein
MSEGYGSRYDAKLERRAEREAAIARELLRWRREAQRLIRMTKDLAGDKYGGDGPNHYGLAKEVHDGLAECLRMIEPLTPEGSLDV